MVVGVVIVCFINKEYNKGVQNKHQQQPPSQPANKTNPFRLKRGGCWLDYNNQKKVGLNVVEKERPHGHRVADTKSSNCEWKHPTPSKHSKHPTCLHQ